MKRAVVVLCALGVLAGCGGSGEDQPKALPPVVMSAPAGAPGSGPNPSGSPAGAPSMGVAPSDRVATPSPSATATSSTKEAAQAASAEEFAKNYVEALNRAYRSLDVTELVALTDPSCFSCQNQIRSLRHAAAVGEHYRGGQVVIESAAAPAPENDETIVLVDVSVPELQVLARDGRVIRTVPPFKSTALNVTVRRMAGHWIVMETTRE